MTYQCTNCKTTKPHTEFSHRRDGRKHLRSRCKECECKRGREWGMKNRAQRSAYSKIWRKNNREKHNWNHRIYAHGFKITWDELFAIYEKQGKRCAICKKEFLLTGRNCLSIDHNHETGKIRGLLCRRCNFVIGLADENPDVLGAAISYISFWGQE